VDERNGVRTPQLDVMHCPNGDEVVLFQRTGPTPDGSTGGVGHLHQAFDLNWDDYDEALATARELGTIDRVIERTGKDIYLYDSEGNYLQLHFARPGGEPTE
jgi:hypothetical protein